MQLLHRSFLFACCMPCLALPVVLPAQARDVTITGSAEMGYDTTERKYDSDALTTRRGDSGDDQEIYISPKIAISSKGVRDTLEAFYLFSPNYNFVGETTEIDHQVHIQNDRFLSQKWTLSLSEDFTYTDDPDKEKKFHGKKTAERPDPFAPPERPLSDPLSNDLTTNHRYWKNTAGVRTSYAAGKDTFFDGGYSFEVLRNDEGGAGYDEYDKHFFSANVTHRLSPYWRTNMGLSYIMGLYDEDENKGISGSASNSSDLDQYGANLGLDYIHSVRDSFPFRYGYSETTYESSRKGTQTHEWSAGWDHAWSPNTRLAFGIGPSYSKTEGLEGDWGYNGYLTFMQQYQHATLTLQLNKKIETENFSGTDDAGVKDRTSARIQLAYKYSQQTSLDLFGSYTQDSGMEPQGIYRTPLGADHQERRTGDATYDTDEYAIGFGWRYEFIQDWTVGAKYSYLICDGDLPVDQYTEHQLVFSLSTSKDFWHSDGR